MPTYDFVCRACGQRQDDVFLSISQLRWLDRGAGQYAIPCACGRMVVEQSYTGDRNWIHPSHSWRYGKWDPGLGMVVESYGHKRALMKRWGLEEASDPVGGNRKLSEVSRHEDYLAEKEQKDYAPVAWGDAPDRIVTRDGKPVSIGIGQQTDEE